LLDAPDGVQRTAETKPQPLARRCIEQLRLRIRDADGAAVVRGGLDVRPPRPRLVARTDRVAHRQLVRPGELRVDRERAWIAGAFEQLGGTGVVMPAARRRHRSVQRLADQIVTEIEPVSRDREQAARAEILELLGDLDRVATDQLREQIRIERASQHRRCDQQSVGIGPGHLRTSEDDVAESRRHRLSLLDGAEVLDEQQSVATGLVMELVATEHRDLAAGEGRELEMNGGFELAQWMMRPDLLATKAAEDDDRRTTEPAQHISDRRQRGCVGPVEIVEQQRDRCTCREELDE